MESLYFPKITWTEIANIFFFHNQWHATNNTPKGKIQHLVGLTTYINSISRETCLEDVKASRINQGCLPPVEASLSNELYIQLSYLSCNLSSQTHTNWAGCNGKADKSLLSHLASENTNHGYLRAQDKLLSLPN